MKNAIVLSSAVLAFAATGVSAAGTQSHEALFNQIDPNGDGVIDLKEAAASIALSEQFEALDKDDSGDLSLEEFKNFEIAAGAGADAEGDSSDS